MKRVTVPEIRGRYLSGEKITMLTAYDSLMAAILDVSSVDILLVGDSLGTVICGEETTLSVTLEQMIYHTRLVSRATRRALVVADMPFLSYQASVEEAVRSAGRLLKEGGAQAVKLEGGEEMEAQVRAIVRAGIPVMGHLGLTPQSVHAMGGYKVQGKSQAEEEAILRSAKALEEVGVFSIVLEGVPGRVAERVGAAVAVPTIGIGAGLKCNGQVLVAQDMLGFSAPGREKTPRFVRSYANLTDEILRAVEAYVADVRSGNFPGDKETYS